MSEELFKLRIQISRNAKCIIINIWIYKDLPEPMYLIWLEENLDRQSFGYCEFISADKTN